MKFTEIIKQTTALLRQKGRIAYRTLQREFGLDEEALEDLKLELIEVQEVAIDKDGKMLVWTGGETAEETASRTTDVPAADLSTSAPSAQPESEAPRGERRHQFGPAVAEAGEESRSR